jgi:23S rRNA pseudouridine1911/1915/1917 synthase
LITLLAAEEDEGRRLDLVLAGRLTDRSRSALRRLILRGHVRVDGRCASKPALDVRAGMRVEVEPPPEPELPGPLSIPIDVVHEDDDLAVVDKPAGLVVHPAPTRTGGTLVHALLGRGMPLAPAGGVERPGIVHRLDGPTSGLLVVAKTDRAYRALADAFARREVRKDYQALVWGRPDPQRGSIERPIGRSRSTPVKMSLSGRGSRPAITHYATREELPGFALLDVTIETGRTHQIRVHLQSIHHAIVGDERYGGRPWHGLQDPVKRRAVREFDRLALHAFKLAFRHPVTGRTVAFVAPLPEEFEALLRILRRR